MVLKKVSDSFTEQVQIVTLQHLNGNKRIFGGQLMVWIDIVAGVAARRHSGCDVSTVAVDFLQFKKPAYRNDTILLRGYLTAAFNTSMEVCVETYVEDISGERSLVNKAYLVFVAVRNGVPVKVPSLLLLNEEEKREFENGKRRQELRKQRRDGNF